MAGLQIRLATSNDRRKVTSAVYSLLHLGHYWGRLGRRAQFTGCAFLV
jgi:hypothetical protein